MTLAAWHCGDRREGSLVLLFHGYAEERSSLLDEASALNYGHSSAVMLVDFRGSGGSSEAYTTVGVEEARDVEYATEHLLDDGDALVLFGRSMGAAAILRAVSEHDVRADGYVLESVFDDLLSTVRNRFGATGLPSFPAAELLVVWGGRQAGFDGFAHRPVAHAASVDAPLLLLHGAEDPRAIVEQARAVAEAARAAGNPDVRFQVFSGVGHEPLLASDRAAWHASVRTVLAEAAARYNAPKVPSPPVPVVHLSPEDVTRSLLHSVRPDRRPQIDRIDLVPLRHVLSLMDPRPMHWNLPESLHPWTRGEVDELPANEPLVERLHYVVHGARRPIEPPWEPTPVPSHDDLVRFVEIIDAKDYTRRHLWIGSGSGEETSAQDDWIEALAGEAPPQFPVARRTATPRTQPTSLPTPTPDLGPARALFASATPWALARPGPRLAKTLAGYPMAPDTRHVYLDVEQGYHQGESGWKAAVEIDRVVDTRLLRSDLAIVWLTRQRHTISHERPLGSVQPDEPATMWYRLARDDEIYEAHGLAEFTVLVRYFEDPAAPTAAPVAVRSQIEGGRDLPVPELRHPYDETTAPIPGRGAGDWRPTTPEPPAVGLPTAGPCLTLQSVVGSTQMWRSFCEGLGLVHERFAWRGGRIAGSRRLIDIHRPGTRDEVESPAAPDDGLQPWRRSTPHLPGSTPATP